MKMTLEAKVMCVSATAFVCFLIAFAIAFCDGYPMILSLSAFGCGMSGILTLFFAGICFSMDNKEAKAIRQSGAIRSELGDD